MAGRVAMASAVLLLLAVSAAAAGKQGAPMMFRDWKAAQGGQAKAQNYYEETEYYATCLQGLSYEKCQTFGALGSGGALVANGGLYYETAVGCCGTDSYSKHQDLFQTVDDLQVGKCWWEHNVMKLTDISTDPDTAKKGQVLEGTFEVTCELNDKAEKCGEPLCGDLVLKAWGRVWQDYNAAIQGQPKLQADTSCTSGIWPFREAEPADNAKTNTPPVTEQPAPIKAAAPGEPAKVVPQEPAKQAAPQQPAKAAPPVKAAIQKKAYGYGDEPQNFAGSIRIFEGYATVISPHRKVTYKEGHFQALGNYILYHDDNEPIAITPSPTQFVAKPYTIDLQLRKTGDY